jgi:predicted transcriptional regulator YdeE
MNTYFVEKAKMILAGVSIRTTNEAEMGPDGGLSQLWETYFQSNIAGQIATVNPEYIYALYTDYESDASGAYTVVIGHEVAEKRHIEGRQLEEGELEESQLVENELEESELEESELEESELVENQFTYAAVPESKYMVFKTKKGPVFEVVAQAWGEIWAYFKESGEVRTYTGDFEIYDSRNFDPADTQVEIYIAIE